MRKIKCDLMLVKREIMKLVGRDVKMKVNRGRKKIVFFDARIEEVYSSVFVVRLKEPESVEIQSFSYSDVLCGDVKMKAL